MKKMYILIIITQFASLLINTGCVTSIKTTPTPTKLSLDTVDKIQLGQSKSAEIKDLFNAPTIIIPDKGMNQSVWIYCDPAPCSTGRLTVNVDNSTDTVISYSWTLKVEDGDRTPASIFKRYSKFNFQKKKYIHDYGHYIDRISVWISTPAGIALKVDPHNDSIISSIYRQDPTKLSNDVQSKTNGFPIVTEE